MWQKVGTCTDIEQNRDKDMTSNLHVHRKTMAIGSTGTLMSVCKPAILRNYLLHMQCYMLFPALIRSEIMKSQIFSIKAWRCNAYKTHFLPTVLPSSNYA